MPSLHEALTGFEVHRFLWMKMINSRPKVGVAQIPQWTMPGDSVSVMSKDFDMEGFLICELCVCLVPWGRIFERRICAPFLNMDLIQRQLRFQTFCR